MAIDPETGEDITEKVIAERLVELEKIADVMIADAVRKYKDDPSKKDQIFNDYYWVLHYKLGHGSIGPATAAAGPLLYAKQEVLAEKLEVDMEEFFKKEDSPMTLSQKEIDALLAAAGVSNERPKADLREKLIEGEESVTREYIRQLIDREMMRQEKKGMEYEEMCMRGELSHDEVNEKVKEVGQGLWWGGEASWGLARVEKFTVKPIKGDKFDISTECVMSYISAHMLAGAGDSESWHTKTALIDLTVNGSEEVETFSFKWK